MDPARYGLRPVRDPALVPDFVRRIAPCSPSRKELAIFDADGTLWVAGYLEVLDAQRSLFSAELDDSQSIRDHLISLIQLYKALGGGWTPEAPKEAGPEPIAGTQG